MEIQEHNHGIQFELQGRTNGEGGKVQQGEIRQTRTEKVMTIQIAETIQTINDHLLTISKKLPFKIVKRKDMNGDRRDLFDRIKDYGNENLFVSSFGYLCKQGVQSGPVEIGTLQTHPYNSFLLQISSLLHCKFQFSKIESLYKYESGKNEIEFDKTIHDQIKLKQFFVHKGEIPQINQIKYDLKRIEKFKIGFVDLGNSSYLNSIVQILLSFDHLTFFVYNQQFTFDQNLYPFLNAFANIVQLYTNTNCTLECFSAHFMKEVVKEKFSGDKEYLPIVLLEEILNHFSSEISFFFSKNPLSFSDDNPLICSSMIDNLFGFRLKEEAKCKKCSQVKISEYYKYFLSLNPSKSESNFDTLLNSHFQKDHIKTTICIPCNSKTDKEISLSLINLPQFLIFHNENNSSFKFSDNFSLKEILSDSNIYDYTLHSRINCSNGIFFLLLFIY